VLNLLFCFFFNCASERDTPDIQRTMETKTFKHGYDDDIRPGILVTNALLIALTLAAIACRVGRRVFLVRSFSWHDGEQSLGNLDSRMEK
jgi:hypothetical protein